MRKSSGKVGEISYTRFGTPMKIIKYNLSNDIDIEFLDEHHVVKNTTYQNFKRGIKNPYDKSQSGVGYFGEGKYKAFEVDGRVCCPDYEAWRAMIIRCYDEQDQDIHTAYYNICSVCKEWHNFQVFAEWYNQNYYDIGEGRMHLDKDIKFEGNKLYSPETCMFAPQRINMIFMEKANKSGLPNGIRKNQNSYAATYNGKQIGTFSSLEEAATAHDYYKRLNILKVAEEYKGRISTELYEALLNWSPYKLNKAV